jgi:hypothetical protein
LQTPQSADFVTLQGICPGFEPVDVQAPRGQLHLRPHQVAQLGRAQTVRKPIKIIVASRWP